MVVNHDIGRLHFANHFILQLLLRFNDVLDVLNILIRLLPLTSIRIISGPLIWLKEAAGVSYTESSFEFGLLTGRLSREFPPCNTAKLFDTWR